MKVVKYQEVFGLNISVPIARALGIESALIVAQLKVCLAGRRSGKFRGGYKWVWNSYKEWQRDFFPWWGGNIIEDYFKRLEKTGIVVSAQLEGKMSRKKSYRLDEELIEALENDYTAHPLKKKMAAVRIKNLREVFGLPKVPKLTKAFSTGNSPAKERLQAELLASKLTMREWYRTIYLQSPHWQELRTDAIRAGGNKCHSCGATNALDVHHLEYRSIFDVQASDLQVLCRTCHQIEHGMKTHSKKRTTKKP